MLNYSTRCKIYNYHLGSARGQLQENQKSLEDMREMSASRASLSMLDTSRDELLPSESSSPSGHNKLAMFKSYDSLDVSSFICFNLFCLLTNLSQIQHYRIEFYEVCMLY